mgnify:CR=1 FL=1
MYAQRVALLKHIWAPVSFEKLLIAHFLKSGISFVAPRDELRGYSGILKAFQLGISENFSCADRSQLIFTLFAMSEV